MLISLREFMTWTDMTIFEIWVTLLSILISSILLVLKLHTILEITFTYVFIPMFAGYAFNLYFLFIIFMRSFVEYKDYKGPLIRFLLNSLRVLLCASFTIMLVSKIGGEFDTKEVATRMSYGLVFVPVWVLMALLSFQVCRSATN